MANICFVACEIKICYELSISSQIVKKNQPRQSSRPRRTCPCLAESLPLLQQVLTLARFPPARMQSGGAGWRTGLETRQEQRDRERFEFIKQWLENLRPAPAGPVDVGPVREFFAEWKAEREHAKAERVEAAAERAAWREDRAAWRRDLDAAATERKTLLERMAENRAALIEARTAAIEARAEAKEAAAQARASLQSTGPIRDALRLLIWLVGALTGLVLVLAGVYYFVLRN